jgi:hypothetical protein
MTDVGIVGSRNYPHEFKVRTLVAGLPFAFYPNEFRVVSGGAPGVDSWAEEEADLLGYPTHIIHANWKVYKKGAGMIRNKLLVDFCDMIFIFWDGLSPGSKNVIKLCKETKTPYTVIGPHDERI